MGEKSLSILIACLLFISYLFGEEKPDKKLSLYKTSIDARGQFDGNRIRCDLENNGIIVSDFSGHSGLEWPKDNNTHTVYASGVWFAGKVSGDIRTAVSEYGPEMVPGPWGGDPEAPENKLYKVSKSDLADPLANEDFQNWPADLGAPWVDVDGDGVYSPLPNGPDHPDFIGDQVVWYVANDGGPGSHDLFGTLPLGIEVQYTIFGFERPDAFGDMMFVKALAINKGGNAIEEMYIGLWSDPDLGDAGDDFVGCDTTLSLGICYNDGVDTDFAGYSGGTPAVGYDFFQGPIVPSAQDTAYAFGRYIPGYKNLGMTSFAKYIGPSPVYYDPNDAIEAYNYMMGFGPDGVPFPYEATGGSRFVAPGDPTRDQGPDDNEFIDGDLHASGDRRFLMNSGPFAMADGDSQEVVFGILHAADGGPFKSYLKLKEVDKIAQRFYDAGMTVVKPILFPEVEATAYPEDILLSWDGTAESFDEVDGVDLLPVPVAFDTVYTTDITDSIFVTVDTVISDQGDTSYVTQKDTVFKYIQILDHVDTLFENQPTRFRFEGYNVYQLETRSGTGLQKKIATFDIINGVEEIEDGVFDEHYGQWVYLDVQNGSDTGVRRYLRIEQDALNKNKPLKVNREYYFAVTAYAYNPYGIPKTIESLKKVIAVRPQYPNRIIIDSLAVFGAELTADHTAGASDGVVLATVVNPQAVTGDEYTISFADLLNDGTKIINWTITSAGSIVSGGNTIQGGVDFLTGSSVGANANPIVDGLLIGVKGPLPGFKDFYVTHNAAGPIDGYAGAAADYNGYPGMGRENIGNQQSNGSTWFITTSSGSNKNYEDFYPYITRYAGGNGNLDGGIGYLIPDDFEFRFTETGGKMWEADAGVFIDVPLECWNIGDVTDPDDDFQLLPMFYDLDGDENGEWNMLQVDSPISGGTNDPYMEGFYVLEHADREAGTDGYEAMIASLTADPTASGRFIWKTGPGLPQAGENQVTRVVMLNMTFANWNGGDVEAADWPANVDAMIPETGTVFRMETTKPNFASDVFVLKTESAKLLTKTFDIDNVKVWPNPYFGYNPEERNPLDQQMHFTHLPETGECKIRIFDLAGDLVRIINHNNTGSQYAIWDLKNTAGKYVASGIYIAHLEAENESVILKLAVIQPAK